MVGAVSVQSLFIEPGAIPGLPGHRQVVGISPFMRGLFTEALSLPLEYELEGRAGALMQLIQYELQQLPVLPLSLRYPAHGALAALCRQFVQEPNIHETIDWWADALSMSRRSFMRLFRRETGLSFVAWRHRSACCARCPGSRQAKPSPPLRSTSATTTWPPSRSCSAGPSEARRSFTLACGGADQSA